MRFTLFLLTFLLFTTVSWAVEIKGVEVAQSVTVAGKNLQLNGAGVRTKFAMGIYVGALYLPAKATATPAALDMPGPKRLSMTFVYSEVSGAKLVSGWNDGFNNNQSTAAMAKLKERLQQFNKLFVTARKGDVYTFDFLADGSTRVVFNGKEAGRIAGGDFQRALLAVWLGDEPADSGLKKAMLGAM